MTCFLSAYVLLLFESCAFTFVWSTWGLLRPGARPPNCPRAFWSTLAGGGRGGLAQHHTGHLL